MKDNLRNFIRKLFIRYNDDIIFKGKVDKLIDEMNGVLIREYRENSTIEFEDSITENSIQKLLPSAITEYVDELLSDRLLLERMNNGVCEKLTILKAIVSQLTYINLTGFSIGIKIFEDDYKDLYLETSSLCRVVVARDDIVRILVDHKETILSHYTNNMYCGVGMINTNFEYNAYFYSVRNKLISKYLYTEEEFDKLTLVLITANINKQLPVLLDNWIAHGLLRVWTKLNIKQKGY